MFDDGICYTKGARCTPKNDGMIQAGRTFLSSWGLGSTQRSGNPSEASLSLDDIHIGAKASVSLLMRPSDGS